MLPNEHLLAMSALRRREFEERAAHARLVRLATADRPTLAELIRCRARRAPAAVKHAVLVALHRPVPAARTAPGRCCPAY